MKRLIALVFAVTVLCASVLLHQTMGLAARAATQQEEQQAPQAAPCTHGEDVLCSHLPLVVVDTLGSEIDRYVPVWSTVTVIDNGGGRNHLQDAPDTETASMVRHRGQSSYYLFPKKQYRLEFFEGQGSDKRSDIALMGMAEECDWVLNGPYLDSTMMRNAMMYEVARQTMGWAPDTRFCEVVLNGEYQGLYLMVEAVKVSENRINLSDYALLDGRTPYLLYRDRYNTETTNIDTYASYMSEVINPVSIRYPNPETITAAQQRFIVEDINAFERLLYSARFDDPETGFMSVVDVDSFATYFVLNEFSMNMDAGYLSTYCYKDLGGKLVMGPVWDFNNSFNHYFPASGWLDENSFTTIHNAWFERMLQCEAFVTAVVEKYRELRAGVLSNTALYKYIDETASFLGNSVNRNYEKWTMAFSHHILGNGPDGNRRGPTSYEEAIAQLKSCIAVHGAYLDANIESLYLLAQPQRQSHNR